MSCRKREVSFLRTPFSSVSADRARSSRACASDQGTRAGAARGAGRITASPPFCTQRESLGVPESHVPSRHRMVAPAGGESLRESVADGGVAARTDGAVVRGAGTFRAPGSTTFTPPTVKFGKLSDETGGPICNCKRFNAVF